MNYWWILQIQVWVCVQVNMSQKYHKLANIIEGRNSRPSTSKRKGRKGPVGSRTWEGDTAHALDMSSIRGNTFLTNHARSRGSMGLPELANLLNKSPLTRNRHEGQPSSFQTKGEVVWPPFSVGRPTWSASQRSVPLVLIFDVSASHSMPRSILGGSRLNSRQKNP